MLLQNKEIENKSLQAQNKNLESKLFDFEL